VTAFLAVLGLAVLPAVASAHPLGNFTINHYAGLTIGRDAVDLDVVIDMAEIPAFQERQSMDTDEDGSVSDEEGDAWAATACAGLVKDLHLALGGAALAPAVDAHSLAFPPGAGGLSTLRLECGYQAPFSSALGGAEDLTFQDTSWQERIGWREIVATPDGTILDTHGLPATSPSTKLTAYPAAMIAQPLDIRSASIAVRPDPAAAAVSPAPTSAAAAVRPAPVAAAGPASGDQPAVAAPAVVPLASLASAVALGAWHALTPGHGKTLMAAYLVGSRGTSLHAVGLGLSVATSHTLGIVALALLIIGAQGVLPPDVVVRATPVVAAVSIVAIGGWMLASEVRRRRPPARRCRRRARRPWARRPRSRHGDRPRPRRRRRPSPWRRRPQPPAAAGPDPVLARAVRPRAGRRADPVDLRADHPARLDRRGPARLRPRPRDRVRARDGGGDDGRRARDGRRPQPSRPDAEPLGPRPGGDGGAPDRIGRRARPRRRPDLVGSGGTARPLTLAPNRDNARPTGCGAV
jgi:hypothetical protein